MRSSTPSECSVSQIIHVRTKTFPITVIRWDEKAGLPRDAIRSQCSTCSRHNEKETGDEED